MPRRKGHGIPPTKRVKQPDAISRSAPLKNKLYNDIPIVNAKAETIQMTVNTVSIKSEPPSIISEVLHSKYLHKKFKKMASTLLSEDSNNHINNVVNGSRLKSGGRVTISPDFTNDSEKVRSSPVTSPKLEAPVNNSQVISSAAGRYVCSYCKLACAKPSVLQKHIRAHTNERPYPCLPCGFAFKTKSNLYKHCRSRAHASKLEESGEKMTVVFDGEEAGSSEDDSLSNVSYSTSLPPRIEMDLEGKEEIPKSIYKPKYRFMEQPLISSFCEKSDVRKENAKSPPRLHLKIPVPNTTPSVSSPSPFTSGSSPSPELIHRHINKLISENQAIVETNDPFWSKKFMQRTNSSDNSCSSPLSTSPSSSPMMKKSVKHVISDASEDVVNCDKSIPKHSKLALALLRPQTSTSPKISNTSPITETLDPQPLNLSTNNKEESLLVQSRKRSYSEGVPERSPKLLKEKFNSVPLKLHNHLAQDIKRFSPSLTEKNASFVCNRLDVKKDTVNNTKNPEGSIIKDLLLKARASGSTIILGTTEVDTAVDSTSLESLALPVDDRAYSPSSQFMCHLCKEPVSYRNAENLEIHQLYHCKRNDTSSRSSLSPSPNADIIFGDSPSYCKPGCKEKEGPMVIVPSHPSPGPLLGSTPLIESYRLKSAHSPVSSSTVLKKRKLDTGTVETRVISATTLRSLEELSKSPMRTNMQMFGGEVKILDITGGETKTLRIDPSNRTPAKNSLVTPLQIVYQGKGILKDNKIDLQDCGPSMVVTIAKQGLHAGGSFLQVPHKTLGEQQSHRQLSSSRSTVPLSPHLSGYQESSKLLIPIITNPGISNISLPGISTSVQLPLIPFTSILADSKVINPLTNITAYNPLTLPPASLLQPISQGIGIPSMYSSGIVSILHGGKEIPYVPGMPGPHTVLPNNNAMPILTSKVESDCKFSKVSESKANHQKEPFSKSFKHDKLHSSNKKPSTLNIPTIQVNSEMIESPGDGHGNTVSMKPAEENPAQALSSSKKQSSNKRSQMFSVPSDSEDSEDTMPEKKFLRPTSLPLKPGTFVPKRQPLTPVLSLVSPETPRPRKSFGQLYLNGHAYTYLGLKCSTRMFFCTLNKPQPIYVPLSPEHNKVSMYSNWKVCSEADPNPLGLEPARAMALYDSRHRPNAYTLAQSRSCEAVTHSTYWTSRSQHSSREESCEAIPKRVKIFAGGFESNEDYIYVRGRGRGRYVCEECGIRCKKPSMLKKHIRTHTDVRPYTCNHCKFSFKTKGNLTKHMKSKAHYKTCVSQGLDPVPTAVDDSCVDEEALAHQQALRETHGLEPTESEEDEEEEEDGDTDDDDDDEDDEDEAEQEGDMEGEDWQAARSLLTLSETIQSATQRQHANAGLVAVSARPSTYPYSFTRDFELSCTAQPQTPILTSISAQREREKVSQNTGLVQGEVKVRDLIDESKPDLGEKSVTARYYFPSSRDLGDPLRVSTVAVKQSTPIDLSNKPTDKNVRACEAAMLLASLCSTMERLPIAKVPAVATENSVLLQAYLTERAVQDSRMKQHQYKHKASILEVRSGAMAPDISAAKENALGILAHTSSDVRRQPTSEPQTNKPQAEFLPPSSCPSPSYVSVLEDGRSMCNICNKVFSKPSQLRLHVNIHYFERPFRCESCAVSFRTKGHLQKHQRSVSHLNKVSMNSTFGTATTTNPRPFKCDDCKIAFRIHGHLAKHLRSKMHIMKLECLGKLPFGTYAELERSGVNMNDIDTTDCENSLESLQLLAQKLYEKDPSKLGQWDPVEMMPHHALSSGDTSSEGEEDIPAPHIPAANHLPPHHSYPVPRLPSLLRANISNNQNTTTISPPIITTCNSPTITSHKGPKHKIMEGLEGKAQVSKTEMGEPVSERRTDDLSES